MTALTESKGPGSLGGAGAPKRGPGNQSKNLKERKKKNRRKKKGKEKRKNSRKVFSSAPLVSLKRKEIYFGSDWAKSKKNGWLKRHKVKMVVMGGGVGLDGRQGARQS